MFQWLRAPAPLPEDLDSIPKSQPSVTLVPWDLMPSPGLHCQEEQTWCTDIHTS